MIISHLNKSVNDGTTGGIVWQTFGWFDGFLSFKLRCWGNVGINLGSEAKNINIKLNNI